MSHDVLRAVVEDPALPRVLLIGDSISIGYTEPVRQALMGKANVQRIPINGASTWEGLKHLDEWLGEKHWHLIHFNWGLHDLKYIKDGTLDLAGEQISTPDQYAQNLDQLIARLKETDARLIWATTTPIPEGALGRKSGDCEIYNFAARHVVAKHELHLNDLYAFARARIAEIQKPQDVHFHEAGSAILGVEVARQIALILGLK